MQVLKNNLDDFLKNEELDTLEAQKIITGLYSNDAYLTITHACLSYIKNKLNKLENTDFMNYFFEQAGINKETAKKLLKEAMNYYYKNNSKEIKTTKD